LSAAGGSIDVMVHALIPETLDDLIARQLLIRVDVPQEIREAVSAVQVSSFLRRSCASPESLSTGSMTCW
jgi:hypothetical protein